ncbi:MAG TPA: PH domain-containing protein [Dermatophilaceae bacterium]|jgi:hypothetical protein|nr:PH domain-containing protein [Dermatophilaceae bacterium]
MGSPLADIERARSNERLSHYLTSHEQIRLAARSHWMVLAKPALTTLGITIAGAWLLLTVPSTNASPVAEILVAIVVGSWGYFIWAFLTFRHDLFVATDQRVMKYQGLFAKSVPMMKVGKITDMHFRQSIPGEVFGYGTVVIESAGQDQALREMRFLPHPLENYRRLCEVIFGEPAAPSRPPRRRFPGFGRGRSSGGGRRSGRDSATPSYPPAYPPSQPSGPTPTTPRHDPAPPRRWEDSLYSSHPSPDRPDRTQPIPIEDVRHRRRRTPWEQSDE